MRTARDHFPTHPAAAPIVAAVVVALALSTIPASATASGAQTGRVRGRVVARATGRPVTGATVTLSDFGATVTSGRDGSFVFPQAFPLGGSLRRVSAVVTASGFGRWSISGVPMWANDTLELNVMLRATPWTHRVRSPQERAASTRPAMPRGATTGTTTCTGWDYTLVPPPDIWVYVTPDKKAEQFDFAFYVSHVLPKEWIPSWDADALAAGAVAVKTYAAFRAMTGNARTSGKGCYDILDTSSDQVFDPNWSLAATDQATNAALGSILWQNGGPFMSHYFSGAEKDKCQPVTGTYAGWMSQWGTETCATNGVVWPDIVQTFYANASWHYTHNFLLDPEAASAGTYAWSTLFGTFTRTKGGAHSGDRSYTITNTTTTRQATFRQVVPWNGTADTTYHSSVALKCLTSNSKLCTMTIRVIAIESNGTTVIHYRTFTEKKDGAWRVYTFDPHPFGVGHKQVRFSVLSQQDYGVDTAYLDSPFGGP